MSIWTSRSALVLATCLLAGCEAGISVGRDFAGALFPREAPDSYAVANNAVIVSGPPGYCIDPDESQDGITAFVLLGSCASITRNPRADTPIDLALVTVTVSSDAETFLDIDTVAEELYAFIQTDPGRATLSRSGDPASVVIRETRVEDGALLFRAEDVSPGRPDGTGSEFWRALLDVNNTLVTVSVLSLEDRPISAARGMNTLSNTIREIRNASGAVSG